MKYGIREICDVVLKAKSRMQVGNKIFYKDEPVIYFDSLKTSTLEGAATTVYAQGGRGNARLIAWEGERTVTFTMEDALISTVGLAILTGADVIDATEAEPIIQHVTETIDLTKDPTWVYDTGSRTIDTYRITLSNVPYTKNDKENYIYVMVLDDNGNIMTEPFLFTPVKDGDKVIEPRNENYQFDAEILNTASVVLVDYYVAKKSGAQQIEITPDKFGGNFYLEASTLFRATNGKDMPAEFIIPNCKIQSNFTFTMASSGDPSTFTFTMDAFPDYTRFNKTKRVLSAIQIIDEESEFEGIRYSTDANPNGVETKWVDADIDKIIDDGEIVYPENYLSYKDHKNQNSELK
jgi:hypothetical protein